MGVPVLVDGAQAVAHQQVDVQALGRDFYCFSGHKLYGPTGIGVLYGREALLDAMPPWQGGGDMIRTVSSRTDASGTMLPNKFEAGTPNMTGAIGLAAAMDYLGGAGNRTRRRHTSTSCSTQATAALMRIPGIHIHGTAPDKATMAHQLHWAACHPHDLGTMLDHEGVAIRAGHHCAMPLMDRWDCQPLPGPPSAATTPWLEVEQLEAAVRKAVEVFHWMESSTSSTAK